MTVPSGPIALSTLLSIITALALPSGIHLISCNSATNIIISKRSSIPLDVFADIGTVIVSPPQSSGTRLSFETICCFVKSIFALGLSILLIATIIGTFALLA